MTYAAATTAYVNLWPSGETRPNVATMFYSAANAPRSNTAVVKIDVNGKIGVYNSSGTAGLTVDVQGSFTGDPTQGGSFTAMTPGSVYSTTSTGVTPLGAGETRTIQVAGKGGIPDDGTLGSVALNVTVRNWSEPKHTSMGISW